MTPAARHSLSDFPYETPHHSLPDLHPASWKYGLFGDSQYGQYGLAFFGSLQKMIIRRDERGANLKAICGNIFGALILRESLVQYQSFPPLNPQIYRVFYCFMCEIYKIGNTVGSKIIVYFV